MVRPGRELLHGTVEVDEAYVGGTKAGIRGRGADGKVLVAVAVECADGVLGRVRFHCVPDVSADSLVPFVCENVTAQSIVVTDGWGAYSSLSTHGFNHAPRKGDGGVKGKDKLLPHVHLVISLLKRWLLGTHQGAVTAEHLQGYLDEFSFRFNRRLSTHRGKLFYRLVQQAVSMRPPSIKEFYVQANHNL